jgi:hypothetical protein
MRHLVKLIAALILMGFAGIAAAALILGTGLPSGTGREKAGSLDEARTTSACGAAPSGAVPGFATEVATVWPDLPAWPSDTTPAIQALDMGPRSPG